MNKLGAMQIFVRVAEAGSFSAVAEQMQLARSVITRQIAALEKQLGVKLITRSTRRLALTTAGATYLEKCRVILNLVDAAEEDISEDRGEVRGRIKLGLPLIFGVQVLGPAILDFADKYRDIELSLDLSDERSNLIEEGLDLTIRITSSLQSGDIVRRLGNCRLLTLASPEYLARNGSPKHPSDLRHHECLLYAGVSTPSSWAYIENGRELRVPVRGRLVANNGVLLVEACMRGLGVAMQPDFIAATYVERGMLKELLREFTPESLGVYAILPSNRYVPYRIRALIEHLSEFLSGSRKTPSEKTPLKREDRKVRRAAKSR